MRESLGSVFLYNIVFIFLAIIFSFLMGTLIYHRAFKLNSKIITAIEKYEGYNKYSQDEIERQLKSIGYTPGKWKNCPATKAGHALSTPESDKYTYCVYGINLDGSDTNGDYYSYGVITYITFDIPIIAAFLKIPIYTQSNRIYNFR